MFERNCRHLKAGKAKALGRDVPGSSPKSLVDSQLRLVAASTLLDIATLDVLEVEGPALALAPAYPTRPPYPFQADEPAAELAAELAAEPTAELAAELALEPAYDL